MHWMALPSMTTVHCYPRLAELMDDDGDDAAEGVRPLMLMKMQKII